MFPMSYAITYVHSSASIRQELSGVTVLIRSTSTNWSWSQWYSIHWESGLLYWMRCCWWWLVMLNPTQDLVSTCIVLLVLISPVA